MMRKIVFAVVFAALNIFCCCSQEENGKKSKITILEKQMEADESYPAMKAIGILVDGHPDGDIKCYSADGKLVVIEPYRKGQKHGTRICYYPNGRVFSEEDFVNDMLHGESKKYYPNGKIFRNMNAVRGNGHGTMTQFYPSGSKSTVATMEASIFQGRRMHYLENGILFGLEMYRDGKVVERKIIEEVDKDHLIKTEEMKKYLVSLKDIWDGKMIVDPVKEVKIKDDKKSGEENIDKKTEATDFLPAMRVVGKMLNGKTDGKVTGFSTNGKIVMVEYYCDGLLDGQRILYYPNGKVFLEVEYVKNLPHGETKTYYPSGSIYEKAIYVRGKEHGEITHYYPGGNRRSVGMKEMGVAWGKRTLYSIDGGLGLVAIYDNNKEISREIISQPTQDDIRGGEAIKEMEVMTLKKIWDDQK